MHQPTWAKSLSIFALHFTSLLQAQRWVERRSNSTYQSLQSTHQRRSNSAWGGYLPENAAQDGLFGGKAFTPFYVPTGSQVIYAKDSASQNIIFTGIGWKDATSDHDDGKETITPGDSIEISWIGQDIEYFGFKAGKLGHGLGQIGIYLDGKVQDSSEILRCDLGETYKQQIIYRVQDLSPKQHHLKIVHQGKLGELLSVFAFVITDRTTNSNAISTIVSSVIPEFSKMRRMKRDSGDEARPWTLLQKGLTGVAAMQLSVISDTEAIIIDKVEHNPLTTQGHPAWAAIYNLKTHQVRPLNPISNSFCAAGSFLGNGTFINVGGNPVVTDTTGAADFGDLNGIQSIRLFKPCKPDEQCDIEEFPQSLSMRSARWYPTVTRLADGSVMIVGGSKKGGWKNTAESNNPTIEYFPAKALSFAPASPQLPIPSPFLSRTLSSNLYPIVITLPMTDTIFMAANNDAMLYNWRTGLETNLPSFPNGVRISYPFTGTGILLPLSYQNGYEAEVLICGGSSIDDNLTDQQVKVSDPASDQCVRMLLTPDGISKGWIVERMPQARIMPDAVLMPDGKVLIVNGGMTGTAGYGNLQGLAGQSNADNPAFTPVLYDPEAPEGERFSSQGMPTSTIARLYHSVATLTSSGKVMIAGSNPNLDRSTAKYQTEYRVEWLSPPYIGDPHRPVIKSLPSIADFSELMAIKLKSTQKEIQTDIKVVLMDFGFVTHGVHMNSRSVELKVHSIKSSKEVTVEMPPSGEVYPPGFAWVFVIINGIPSEGRQIMVGTGEM